MEFPALNRYTRYTALQSTDDTRRPRRNYTQHSMTIAIHQIVYTPLAAHAPALNSTPTIFLLSVTHPCIFGRSRFWTATTLQDSGHFSFVGLPLGVYCFSFLSNPRRQSPSWNSIQIGHACTWWWRCLSTWGSFPLHPFFVFFLCLGRVGGVPEDMRLDTPMQYTPFCAIVLSFFLPIPA